MRDFGIARALPESDLTQNLTRTGSAIGTYAYMSPEQCEGAVRAMTTRADVYSLAAILYEIVTGDPPFGRGMTAVAGHVEKPLPPVGQTSPYLPSELDAVLGRGLAKSPDDRYPTAGELVADFLAVVTGPTRADSRTVLLKAADATVQPDATRLEAPARRRRRPSLPRWIIAALAVVIVAAAAVALGVVRPGPVQRWLPRLGGTAARVATPRPSPGLPTTARAAVGQTVDLAGLRVTVVSANTNAPGIDPFLPAAGRRFVNVEVLCVNTGSDPLISDPGQWQLIDSSGYSYTTSLTGAGPLLSYEVLAPGDKSRGVLGFNVPQSAGGLTLRGSIGSDVVTVPLS